VTFEAKSTAVPQMIPVVTYIAVFLCGLPTLREKLLYEKAISRTDAKAPGTAKPNIRHYYRPTLLTDQCLWINTKGDTRTENHETALNLILVAPDSPRAGGSEQDRQGGGAIAWTR